MSSNNDLIFGRDNTERIVSTEVVDDKFIAFIENKDGTVTEKIYDNENWVVSTKPLANDFEELEGNLHYKYGKIYTDNNFFQTLKPKFYKYDTYFINDDREQNLIIKGVTYFKNMTPKDVSILSFDLETTGLVHDETSKILLIANTFRKNGVITRKMFCYDEYENEGKMIEAWCSWVVDVNPAILCGHNILDFDLSYLKFIAEKFGVKLKLGRWGQELVFNKKPSKFRVDGNRDQEYFNVRCFGREILDSMFLAIKYDFGKKYESYGLKQIIKQEKLENENRTFYDASKIRENYLNPLEWLKIKDYARDDGDDPIKLVDLMIASYFYFNQSIPKSFQQMILQATGSQLNSLLVRSYLQIGHSIPKADRLEEYPGAISFSNKGIHRNVFKVDVASLYPSIILQYNIYDKKKDPNANFLKMVQYFTKERLKNKHLAKETGEVHYKDMEQAQKIGINSAYGLLGASGLNFNKFALASLVTEKGRDILQDAIQFACGYKLQYVKTDEDEFGSWEIPA